jgi:uncharacterized protein YehS (DUF1456 family)
MITVFAQAELSVTRSQVSNWLKKDEDPEQQQCDDRVLSCYLNGLINAMRGKKEGPQPEPEDKLDNNIIFKKLKIALNLKAEDILRIMGLVDFTISKHELSAFFRKKGHKHYRECQEQILRNFLHGVQIEYRKEAKKKSEKKEDKDEQRPKSKYKPR